MKIFPKNKKKNKNIVANDIKISLKMKNKGWLFKKYIYLKKSKNAVQ